MSVTGFNRPVPSKAVLYLEGLVAFALCVGLLLVITRLWP